MTYLGVNLAGCKPPANADSVANEIRAARARGEATCVGDEEIAF